MMVHEQRQLARLERVAVIVAGILAGQPGAATEPPVRRALELDDEVIRQVYEAYEALE